MKSELVVQDKKYAFDEIINLGIGGCLLQLETNLDPGTPCTLHIILKKTGNEPTVTVDGTIVRSERGNVAIKFIRIDLESLHHLQKIARYNSPDPDQVEQEIKEHPGLI